MSVQGEVRRLRQELGDLLEQHEDASDLSGFEKYRDDPVAFVREVIGDDPWSRQADVMASVVENRNTSVRSCNAAGKSKLAAWLPLWWSLSRQGLAVITTPTERQGTEIIMRREAWRAHSKGGLPGSIYTNAYRPREDGAAGVVLKTATAVSSLTGFHEEEVLFVIDEAQDHERLDPHAWDAAFAVATGEHDRKLALGNPLHPLGRFYNTHQPSSDWRSIRIPASDIPNVREGKTVIPGLLSREAIDDMAAEYGRDSGFFRARVQAEFPEESEEGLFRRDWLRAAGERHDEGEMLLYERERFTQRVLGVDVARHGADKTVVAIRRGPVLERFEAWSGADTEETAERVHEMAHQMGAVHRKAPNKPAVSDIVVDSVGVGAGVFDNLKNRDAPWDVHEHKGSRTAWEDDRYRNVRAEASWLLRERCRRGKLALPDDEELVQELMGIKWRPDPQDRVQLEAKDELRDRLGRSPDKADATLMAFYVDATPRGAAKVSHFPWA